MDSFFLRDDDELRRRMRAAVRAYWSTRDLAAKRQ